MQFYLINKLARGISQLNEDDSIRLPFHFVIEMGAGMQSTVNAPSAVGTLQEILRPPSLMVVLQCLKAGSESKPNELRNGSPSAINVHECSPEHEHGESIRGDGGSNCAADAGWSSPVFQGCTAPQ